MDLSREPNNDHFTGNLRHSSQFFLCHMDRCKRSVKQIVVQIDRIHWISFRIMTRNQLFNNTNQTSDQRNEYDGRRNVEA